DAPFLAAGDRFDGEVAAADAEALGDVLPCPEPNRGDADAFARSFAEDAIGDFEDGAIAAAGDEELAARIDRLFGQFDSVPAMRGEDHVGGEAGTFDGIDDGPDAVARAAAAGVRIDDEERLGGHLRRYALCHGLTLARTT